MEFKNFGYQISSSEWCLKIACALKFLFGVVVGRQRQFHFVSFSYDEVCDSYMEECNSDSTKLRVEFE